MNDLRELYQEVILDHNKQPRNFGKLEQANCHAEGYNPLCGDRLNIWMNFDGDVIVDVNFLGSGCAISTASASLMTDAVKGKTINEAQKLCERFKDMITRTSDTEELDSVELGKLVVFAGVREYPVRVKCASLAWHTLLAAFKDSNQISTTE